MIDVSKKDAKNWSEWKVRTKVTYSKYLKGYANDIRISRSN